MTVSVEGDQGQSSDSSLGRYLHSPAKRKEDERYDESESSGTSQTMQDGRVSPSSPPQLELTRLGRSFAAYALAFSPFFPNKLAVAGAANFGLVGNGRLSLIDSGGGFNNSAGMMRCDKV